MTLARVGNLGVGADDVVALVGGEEEADGDRIDLVGQRDDGLGDAVGEGGDAVLLIF